MSRKLTYQEARNIVLATLSSDVIRDEFTIEFDWGFVFSYESIGGIPILVDKYTGETRDVGCRWTILDSDLEKYREEKDYPHEVKFPIQKSLKGLSLIDKVDALFRTCEILQIKEGIEIVIQNKLFDIDDFIRLVRNPFYDNWTIEEYIAGYYETMWTYNRNIEEYDDTLSLILGSSVQGNFPKELVMFKRCEYLSLSGTTIKNIDDNILQLPNLKVLDILYCQIERITSKILQLPFLEKIVIADSTFSAEAKKVLKIVESKIRVEYHEGYPY